MSKKPKSKAVTEISTADLGKLLGGLSARTIRALAERGDVVRVGVGRYDKWASVAAYCAGLRKAAAGRASPTSEQRARLVKLQADALERANIAAAGELVRVDDVRSEWTGLTHDMRAAVPIIVGRIRQVLPALDDTAIAMLRTELEASVAVMDPDIPPGLKGAPR